MTGCTGHPPLPLLLLLAPSASGVTLGKEKQKQRKKRSDILEALKVVVWHGNHRGRQAGRQAGNQKGKQAGRLAGWQTAPLLMLPPVCFLFNLQVLDYSLSRLVHTLDVF